MKTTFIYGLSDPRDPDNIRYIGKSNDPKNRLFEHISRINCKLQSNTHKNNWIRSLLKNNLKPKQIILAEVPIEDWKWWEKYYYETYLSYGNDLTNVANCIGNGGLSENRKPSSNKETINKRIKENPLAYRCKPILKIDINTNEIVARYESAKLCCEAENIRAERLRECIKGYKIVKGKKINVNQIKGFKYTHERN